MEHFRKHYSNKLHNYYMRNINHSKHVTNNSKHFHHYFDNVNA